MPNKYIKVNPTTTKEVLKTNTRVHTNKQKVERTNKQIPLPVVEDIDADFESYKSSIHKDDVVKVNLEKLVHNKKRYYRWVNVKPVLKDQTIFVLGGGPSLKGFDMNRLKDKNVIAVNKAMYFAPFADFLYFTDTRFYNWYKKDIHRYNGHVFTCRATPVADDIYNLVDKGRVGLELADNALRHGNNSGYAAINLAYHLGASRIILLGFDMGIQGGRTHFHNGYKTTATPNVYTNNMLPNFPSLTEPLAKRNVEVLNACPKSRIECFKKISLEEAVSYV